MPYTYVKTHDGYVRYKPYGDKDRFVFDTLTNDVNRAWWRKVYRWLVCKPLGHTMDNLIVRKGWSTEYGTYEIRMCAWCRSKVMFCEGIIK